MVKHLDRVSRQPSQRGFSPKSGDGIAAATVLEGAFISPFRDFHSAEFWQTRVIHNIVEIGPNHIKEQNNSAITENGIPAFGDCDPRLVEIASCKIQCFQLVSQEILFRRRHKHNETASHNPAASLVNCLPHTVRVRQRGEIRTGFCAPRRDCEPI
jgi:hypothetical protein